MAPDPAQASSAHVDRFALDRLPPPDALPEFVFDGPGLQLPPRLNASAALLDAAVARGWGARPCLVAGDGGDGIVWSYAQTQQQVNRIAHVLVRRLGLVPGNRVLLRGANTPMLAACLLAVIKAGGIAVGTMPLLRARELATLIDKAQISHALCDARLADELAAAAQASATLRTVLHRHAGHAGRAGSRDGG
jgi:2-aminobenzoate-CoA ligase